MPLHGIVLGQVISNYNNLKIKLSKLPYSFNKPSIKKWDLLKMSKLMIDNIIHFPIKTAPNVVVQLVCLFDKIQFKAIILPNLT